MSSLSPFLLVATLVAAVAAASVSQAQPPAHAAQVVPAVQVLAAR